MAIRTLVNQLGQTVRTMLWDSGEEAYEEVSVAGYGTVVADTAHISDVLAQQILNGIFDDSEVTGGLLPGGLTVVSPSVSQFKHIAHNDIDAIAEYRGSNAAVDWLADIVAHRFAPGTTGLIERRVIITDLADLGGGAGRATLATPGNNLFVVGDKIRVDISGGSGWWNNLALPHYTITAIAGDNTTFDFTTVGGTPAPWSGTGNVWGVTGSYIESRYPAASQEVGDFVVLGMEKDEAEAFSGYGFIADVSGTLRWVMVETGSFSHFFGVELLERLGAEEIYSKELAALDMSALEFPLDCIFRGTNNAISQWPNNDGTINGVKFSNRGPKTGAILRKPTSMASFCDLSITGVGVMFATETDYWSPKAGYNWGIDFDHCFMEAYDGVAMTGYDAAGDPTSDTPGTAPVAVNDYGTCASLRFTSCRIAGDIHVAAMFISFMDCEINTPLVSIGAKAGGTLKLGDWWSPGILDTRFSCENVELGKGGTFRQSLEEPWGGGGNFSGNTFTGDVTIDDLGAGGGSGMPSGFDLVINDNAIGGDLNIASTGTRKVLLLNSSIKGDINLTGAGTISIHLAGNSTIGGDINDGTGGTVTSDNYTGTIVGDGGSPTFNVLNGTVQS